MSTPIVIVSPSEFPGSSGDTYNFLELIDQFLLEGFKVLLICPKSSKNRNLNIGQNNSNLEIVRINYRPPRLNELGKQIKIENYFGFIWFLLLETYTLLRIIKTKKVKKLYVRHSILTMQLPILFKLLRVTTLADGEIVSDTIKHLLPSIFFKLFSTYEKNIIRLYSYFKVSSISQLKNLEAVGYPRGKIIILPISINTEKITKFRLEEIPEHTFGYFGGLESWQGIDALIKAFKLLVEKVPSAILYIIGDGSLLNELQRTVLENNLTANILFVGKIKRERLWEDYFGKFRIVIIPRQKLNNSIDTILPIKLVEAMAGGKPIIAMDIPVMREIHGNPLVLVPSGNPQLLANAMYSLSTSVDEMRYRSKLSGNSSLNYDIRNNIKKIILILKH
ncbi:glycosyltransferase [Candidatus Nitrosocosmicus arcticus]|nr:glycosyltransferase [Candidatus Nitrosocosmicus arcticus]